MFDLLLHSNFKRRFIVIVVFSRSHHRFIILKNGLKEAQEVGCFPLVALHVPDQDAVVLWTQSGEVRVAELHEAVEPTVNGNTGEVACANNVTMHDPEHRGGDEPHVENVVKQQVRIVRYVVNLIA